MTKFAFSLLFSPDSFVSMIQVIYRRTSSLSHWALGWRHGEKHTIQCIMLIW